MYMDGQIILNEYREKQKDLEEELLPKLIEAHKIERFRVKQQCDRHTKVCFVFSCPGQQEMLEDKLCAGQTGDNLNLLLSILNKMNSTIFPYLSKSEYDILNATPVVHFKKLDGKTEGTKKEINENIPVVETYIKSNPNLKYAIFCGNKAKLLIDSFRKKKIIVISINHLGFQSVNQINKDSSGKIINEETYENPEERTKARIEKIANDIIGKIEVKS